MNTEPYSREKHIADLNAAIEIVKKAYAKSTGREAYRLGAKLRALQTELNSIL